MNVYLLVSLGLGLAVGVTAGAFIMGALWLIRDGKHD